MRRARQPAADTQRLEERCRARGLALTVQRRAIFAAIARRRDHPTADEVYESLRRSLPGVSRTTVYRVLETLVRAGLIAKACHPGAAARYDPLTHRHHHLVCIECEKVIDLEDARLDALPLPRVPIAQFEIQDYCIHFRGLCAACRNHPSKRRKTR
jgi:Fur family peroxide stress response transcriptional regulator